MVQEIRENWLTTHNNEFTIFFTIWYSMYIVTAGTFERNESGRFGALKFNPPFLLECLYQVRVITVFPVFRLLTDFFSVYIIMSFDFPFVRLFGVR